MSENELDILPKKNSFLQGFAEEEQFLLSAWKNNSLHNSWLISGVEGIGKATFAYKLARFILSADASQKDKYNSLDVDINSQIFKLISSNSHPDLKIIEKDYIDSDKRKIIKAIKEGDNLNDDELKSLKRSSNIKVDEVRTINEFLSKRSSSDGWRVVIVDM